MRPLRSAVLALCLVLVPGLSACGSERRSAPPKEVPPPNVSTPDDDDNFAPPGGRDSGDQGTGDESSS